jgi:MOSC domain-containing protein YiiM
LGKLAAIWIKRMHRGPMDARSSAKLIPGTGFEHNADRGGRRQVTLLEAERWAQMMSALNSDLDPSTRRANLLVEGIDLAGSRGKTLRVGNCTIRIRGETRPCERMEEALPGLRQTMSAPWYGGAYGDVVKGGSISIGDEVEWADE